MGAWSRKRIAVVVAGLAVLVGAHPPSASAKGSKAVVFVGNATVTGGLGYPCTPSAQTPAAIIAALTATPDLLDNDVAGGSSGAENKTCPPDVAVNPTASRKQKLVEVNGWTRTGSLAGVSCIASGVTAAKNTKAPADAGLCSIGSTFVVTGYCGLSQAEGRATISIVNEVGANQSYGVHYLWFDSGTLLTLRGQAWRGTGSIKPAAPEWAVIGVIASALPNLAASGTSCTNKTGHQLLIQGVIDLLQPDPSTLP